jgi:hypothetical protein
MIVRMKSGEYRAGSTAVLLDLDTLLTKVMGAPTVRHML